MFDPLVRCCYFIQGKGCGDVKTTPSRFERVVNVANGFELGFNWNVVAAHEKQSCVDEHKLPYGNVRLGCIRGVRCNRSALRQHLDVGSNVRCKRHLDDVVDALRCECVQAILDAVVDERDLIRTGPRRDFTVPLGQAGCDDPCTGLVCEPNRKCSNRTCAALHQDRPSAHRPRDIYSAMCRQPGNAQTCSVLEGDTVGQGCGLPQRNNGELCGSAKWAIGLRTVTPDLLPDPFLRYACTYSVDGTRTIAMRDDSGTRHSDAERV